jgi:hypothetical protein
MCKVPNDVQIEHQRLPMLDLGIINKQTMSSSTTTTTTVDDTHPLSPPALPSLHRHRHTIITVNNTRLRPHLLPTTSTTRTTWQRHIT